MRKSKANKPVTIASRLYGIVGIQIILCVILFTMTAFNQPYQSYRQYIQNTQQAAAMFSVVAVDMVSTMEASSKYAGQILNSATQKTFIREALTKENVIQDDLAFCRELYQHSKTLMYQHSMFNNVAVYDLDGNAVYVTRDYSSYYLTKSAADALWIEKVLSARGGAVIFPCGSEGIGLPSVFEDDLIVARAVFDPLKLKAEGIYLLSIERNSLEVAFDTYRVGPEQTYALVYHGQTLINRFENEIPEPPEMPLREMVSRMVKAEDGFYLYSYYLYSGQSYLCIRSPLSAILTGIFGINIALIAVAFLVLCLFVVIIWRLLDAILRPLHNLTGALDAATGSVFPVITQDAVPAELEPLFDAYNRMSIRIDHLVNEGFRKDIANREIELQLLRTQINPHYLYNTLECLHMRAYVNHDFEVAHMAELLGSNLQYGLRATNATVPLHMEFEKAGEYMTLVSYRHGDRVRLVSHLDDSIRNCLVIKFLLQPLIENSIQHGLRVDRPLCIEVMGYPVDKDHICLQVSDDGEGMTTEDCEALMRQLDDETGGDAIGLRNVHRRLRLRYGADCGVQIRSFLHQTTVVTLTLPREEGKENT